MDVRAVGADHNPSERVTGIRPAAQACARPPVHDSGAGYPARNRQNFSGFNAIALPARVLPRSPQEAESAQRVPHCYPRVWQQLWPRAQMDHPA